VLVELANETIAAAEQIGVRLSVCVRIRKAGSANGIFRGGYAAMSVRCFDSRPVNNETEQQQREYACKRTMRLD
jgi:hypothetical protein